MYGQLLYIIFFYVVAVGKMLKHWPTVLYSVIKDESDQQPKDMISDCHCCVSALGKKGLATGTVEATEAWQREHQGRKEGRGLAASCTFLFLATQN